MRSGSSDWTRRLEIVVAAAVFAVVALGARDVTDQIGQGPPSRERLRRMIRPWCEQISAEVPAREQAKLSVIAKVHPEWLLIASSRRIETASQPRERSESRHAELR